MSSPQFGPIDDDTAAKLEAVADQPSADDHYAAFLRACQTEAELTGHVSINRVRVRLAHLRIPPRTYSAFWRKATGKNGPMQKIDGAWETCAGSTSGNDGRPFPLRRWVG